MMPTTLLSPPSIFTQPAATVQALPRYYFLALGLGLLCIAAWEYSSLDHALASLSFNSASQTFEWRQHWLLTTVLHAAVKNVLLCGLLGLLIIAALPNSMRMKTALGRAVPRSATLAFFVMLLAPAVVVSALKSQSLPFCPWDELAFGGAGAQYQWWQPLFETVAGKFGRCWPAGHASAGFGMVGSYFFARLYAPRYALKVLVLALALGCVMGIAQQIRGAHYMSHTLWTAWIAWACCGALAPLLKKCAVKSA